jgi:hypothetical protein
MSPDRLVVVCGNVLLKRILEAPRADAKRLFNDINSGKQCALAMVRMDDETEVAFEVRLDASEFRGPRLNFREFRNSLAGLLHSLGEYARQEARVPVFNEKSNGDMLFGVPGFTRIDDELNVMMLSVNLRKPGAVQLALMYVDPDQFKQPREPESGSALSG